MNGAALTTVLAYAIMVASAWMYSQKAYPVAYDWPRIGRVLIVAVVVSGAALAAPSGGLADFGWALGAWLVFLFALVATGSVTRAELAAGRRWAVAVRSRVRRRVAGGQVVG